MTSKQSQKKKKDMEKETPSQKEKIAELRKKKKEMEEELDELKGRTPEGRIKCAVAFIITILVCLGIFIGFIKTDTGNFASGVLAPLIADVPIVRNVLPKDLQKKSDTEIEAEQAAALEAAAQAQAQAEAEAQAAEEAALADYVDTYSQMKPRDAANVFDNMMPDESDLVVRILENLSPAQRADILSNMNVNNASDLTVMMER